MPVVAARLCEYCEAELIRKPNEESREWNARMYCSRLCSNRARRAPLEIRFWKLVQLGALNECWEWQGSQKDTGYGKYLFQGTQTGAHRVAWILTYGPVPDGLHVLHNCPEGDNPRCCNPTHLFLGTHQDNMDDMIAKGRDRKRPLLGDSHPGSKLTSEIVTEARRLYREGLATINDLAKKFGVTKSTMGSVIRRKTWTHLQEEVAGNSHG